MKTVNTKLMIFFIFLLCINIAVSYGAIYEIITGKKTSSNRIVSEVRYLINKCTLTGGSIMVHVPMDSIGKFNNMTIVCVGE